VSARTFGYPPARMTAPHAAYYLGVSESKFYAGVNSGEYPLPVKDGGNTLWLRADIDAFIQARHNGGAKAGAMMSLEDQIRAAS
jgi:predicted DNA-binding transcriptional regulator AlpA